MELEVRTYPGLPPVYNNYRAVPLGRSLKTVLDEFKDLGLIHNCQIELVMSEFDRAMTQHLDQLNNGSFNISVGTVTDFRRIDQVFKLLLAPAVIQFPEGTYTSESLEIVAYKGREAKQK